MPADRHIHVCARCSVEHNSPTAYPPPGWVWRGSRLYCDGCCSLVADPIDDAQPRDERDPDDLPAAVIMLASGALFNLTCPHADEIDIQDIAQALSRICRFLERYHELTAPAVQQEAA
jgi:hypothetical protein